VGVGVREIGAKRRKGSQQCRRDLMCSRQGRSGVPMDERQCPLRESQVSERGLQELVPVEAAVRLSTSPRHPLVLRGVTWWWCVWFKQKSKGTGKAAEYSSHNREDTCVDSRRAG
jgi:hypothetical protein